MKAEPMPYVRPGTPADARAIAEIHVTSWQAAYRGQLPQDYLESLDVDEREHEWEAHFDAPGDKALWVAELDGKRVGFALVGPGRDFDNDPATIPELYALYCLEEAWGTGAGGALMDRVLEHLRERRIEEATLWVLEANARARRFYERQGWVLDGARKECVTEVPSPEVRYRLRLG